MKVGILSDSPTVTTGFGIITNQIAHALAARHEVVCFGIKAWRETFDRNVLPFRVWNGGLGGHWIQLFPRFLQIENIDVLLLNMDIFNMHECLTYCIDAELHSPIISYLTLDGVPVYRKYIDIQARAKLALATTQYGARYLEQCGLKIANIAPPGVDMATFQPLSNREQLRRTAGLDNRFVVGVFGRNTERKQQVRVLLALATLRRQNPDNDVLVYFHCQPKGYWDLEELAAELDVADCVLFPSGRLFDETAGVPYMANHPARLEVMSASAGPRMPQEYSYVERMNCCDLIVNASHCGGFERAIIESQACGIPIAGTDDKGTMTEVLGNGGILLEAIDVSFWKAGQRQYLISIPDTVQAIREVYNQPGLHAQLREAGFENARKYPWEKMCEVMVATVARL